MSQTALRAAPREKEFEFTARDFTRVRELIYRHAGIALSPSKREMVYSRISRRLRALDLGSFEDYLDHLETHASNPEWENFVNALTTNLTAFFRESHHFDILARFLESRQDKSNYEIKIWCCAASTGEEPYSLAMTLVETLGSWTPKARLIATDIDTDVLAQAERGVYTLDRLEKIDPARVKRFFQKGTGAQAGYARVRPELAALIDFQPLNLLADGWPLKQKFDAIFCRNVMIYFDKPTQAKILSRFVPLMKPDGLLFAGHSENFSYITQQFRLQEKTVYRRVDAVRDHAA